MTVSSMSLITANRALGIASNTDLQATTLENENVGTDDVLVKYTYVGDCNLDGLVTPDDFTLFVSGITGGPAKGHWMFGDFDYNGIVNPDDFTAFVAGLGSFNAGGGTQLSEDFKAQLAAFASDEGIPLVLDPAPVPEPTTFGILALAGGGMLARRRRNPCASRRAAHRARRALRTRRGLAITAVNRVPVDLGRKTPVLPSRAWRASRSILDCCVRFLPSMD